MAQGTDTQSKASVPSVKWHDVEHNGHVGRLVWEAHDVHLSAQEMAAHADNILRLDVWTREVAPSIEAVQAACAEALNQVFGYYGPRNRNSDVVTWMQRLLGPACESRGWSGLDISDLALDEGAAIRVWVEMTCGAEGLHLLDQGMTKDQIIHAMLQGRAAA